MARLGIALVAIVVGIASWVGLIYLFRYSGVAALENLTFWISHWAFTGWLLCIALIGFYYWVFSILWRTFNQAGGSA